MGDGPTNLQTLGRSCNHANCPLCRQPNAKLWFRGRRRNFLRCEVCELVFVPPFFHLSPEAEKAEYDLHDNSTQDAGYRRFLRRLFDPFVARLEPGSKVLDFGCGSGPALAAMLTEAGHSCHLFDKFYAKDEDVWSRSYDGICATEVVEHLAYPGTELQRLWNHLTTGGCLAIMTKRVIDKDRFSRWHYKNDLTHICFFSEQTFAWLAAHWQADLAFEGADVVVFMKK